MPTTVEAPVVRARVAAAEIEMPYLEDEKGASGWSAVEVRSRKNLPGNKRGYCLREHQAVPPVRTIAVVRTRDSTFPTENSFTRKRKLGGRARCKVTELAPLGDIVTVFRQRNLARWR
jgi:hypothetical protein